MFKQYNDYVEEYKQGNLTDINKVAYTHSKEVAYLKHISTFLMYDYRPDYHKTQAHVKKAYQDRLEFSNPKDARERLKNEGYSVSYYENKKGYVVSFRSDINSVDRETHNLLKELLNKIVSKERYITMLENSTEETEYNDEILTAISKVRMNTYTNRTCTTRYLKAEVAHYEITEEENNFRSSGVELVLHLDAAWYENVYKKELYTVAYKNALCYVLSMTPTSTQGALEYYDATIVYHKGTLEQREEANEYYRKDRLELVKAMTYSEVISIVIDTSTTEDYYAVGKDDAWALRNLKRRQKAQMIKQLGL